MKQLIFGSCAVKHWFPDFRIPNDIDIISPESYWIPAFEYLITNNKHDQYVDADLLFTIKVSHASWDIHWDKTIKDICYLKNKKCNIDKEFFQLLINDWNIYHKSKSVKLTGTNDKFFNANITRKFDHDWLHSQLSFYNEPLHHRIRPDKSSPMCNEDLFLTLSFTDQIRCALEEIYVIATERFLVYNKSIPLQHAKYKALRLLITSLTKNWFNLFLILNFETLMNEDNTTWSQKLQLLNL